MRVYIFNSSASVRSTPVNSKVVRSVDACDLTRVDAPAAAALAGSDGQQRDMGKQDPVQPGQMAQAQAAEVSMETRQTSILFSVQSWRRVSAVVRGSSLVR